MLVSEQPRENSLVPPTSQTVSVTGERQYIQPTVADDLLEDGDVNPIYQAKSRIVSEAIQEIGMGRYQFYLICCTGFGYIADSSWVAVPGLILVPLLSEFDFDAPFLSLARAVGEATGAMFWSFGCDYWGRRWSFILTLLISGAFGVAAGGSNTFVLLASLLGLTTFGCAGNSATDGTILLEFLPSTHQYLLYLLSTWWSIGDLSATLIAWPLIANFSCSTSGCSRSANMGWRYLMFTLGGIQLLMWVIRAFVFKFLESPRYLVGIGKDLEAVKVIHEVASFNKTNATLTLGRLDLAGKELEGVEQGSSRPKGVLCILRRGRDNVRALFKTRKMGLTTTILIVVRSILHLALTLYNSFMPYILRLRGVQFQDASVSVTYRNLCIISAAGLLSPILVTWMVERRTMGRKGTLAVAAVLTGVFLLASTTSRTSNALLGWNCAYSFTVNMVTTVLFSISTETFPAVYRGTGNSVVGGASSVSTILAPIIALYADIRTAVPVYIAGGLFIFAGAFTLLLPYEPRGKTSN
ncbi:hypothetical protein PQX77_005780 [Marasmius sp. AFHP31]|nr:hypothetical protein PQX77_005780 [Marasmius sp. AFHP31]